MKKGFLLIIIGLIFNSCDIDIQTGGCIDPYAANYESFADFDDGSCLYSCNDPYATNYGVLAPIEICDYQADVVFFEDVAAATYFDALGIDWLDIYVGTDYVGTLQANLGFTYVPDCFPEDPDAVHFTLLWQDTPTASFTWTVRDGSGTIHYSGTDVTLANNCLPMELTYKKIQEYKESTK